MDAGSLARAVLLKFKAYSLILSIVCEPSLYWRLGCWDAWFLNLKPCQKRSTCLFSIRNHTLVPKHSRYQNNQYLNMYIIRAWGEPIPAVRQVGWMPNNHRDGQSSSSFRLDQVDVWDAWVLILVWFNEYSLSPFDLKSISCTRAHWKLNEQICIYGRE